MLLDHPETFEWEYFDPLEMFKGYLLDSIEGNCGALLDL